MNHQGLRWSVHWVTNVELGKRLNLYKRGFKIYDLLGFFRFRRNLMQTSDPLRQLWITQSLIFTRQMLLKPNNTDNVKDNYCFLYCV